MNNNKPSLSFTVVYSHSFCLSASELPNNWNSMSNDKKQEWICGYVESDREYFDGPYITDCSEEDLID